MLLQLFLPSLEEMREYCTVDVTFVIISNCCVFTLENNELYLKY